MSPNLALRSLGAVCVLVLWLATVATAAKLDSTRPACLCVCVCRKKVGGAVEGLSRVSVRECVFLLQLAVWVMAESLANTFLRQQQTANSKHSFPSLVTIITITLRILDHHIHPSRSSTPPLLASFRLLPALFIHRQDHLRFIQHTHAHRVCTTLAPVQKLDLRPHLASIDKLQYSVSTSSRALSIRHSSAHFSVSERSVNSFYVHTLRLNLAKVTHLPYNFPIAPPC